MAEAVPQDTGSVRAGHLLNILGALVVGDTARATSLVWRDGELAAAVLGFQPEPARAVGDPRSGNGHLTGHLNGHAGGHAGVTGDHAPGPIEAVAVDPLRERFHAACTACDPYTLRLLVCQLLRHTLERGQAAGSDAEWRQAQLQSEVVRALAEGHGDTAAESYALQLVLASAGIEDAEQLPWLESLWLADIREFAGHPTGALHDAHPVVRYAHVARLALTEDADAADTALRQLFGVGAESIETLLAQARARVDALVAEAHSLASGLSLERLLDTLAVLDGSRAMLADANTPDQVVARGQALLRRVGCGVVEYLMHDDSRSLLSGPAGGAAAQLSVHTDIVRSRLASCFQSRRSVRLTAECEQLSVIDRQFMRLLGGEAMHVTPVLPTGGEPCFGLLLAGDSGPAAGARSALDLELVAAEVAHWLGRALREDRRRRKIEADYLAANEQRLREVVHEANNPLSIVHNYLHILGLRLKDEDAGRDQLHMIGEEIRRTGDIIRSLLEVPMAISSQDGAAPVRKEVDVNQLITDLVGMLDAALLAPSRVEVLLDLDPEPLRLPIEADKLKQVLSNLVRNAVEAMPDGGELFLSTQARVIHDDRPSAEIQVGDNGPGLDPEVFEHLFEPKQTRKAGTHEGLGLHIVRQLMDELGGSISCQTRMGRGTRFRLLLPRAPG